MGRKEGSTNKKIKYEVTEENGDIKLFKTIAEMSAEYNIERTTLWRHFKSGKNAFGRQKKKILVIHKITLDTM